MANRRYSQERCSSHDRLTLKEHQAITVEFVDYFSSLDTNMLVLDAVCGDGFFLEILRNLGFESIYGIDTVAPDLEIARSKGLRVLEGSVYDLDLRDKLDVILLCNDLEQMENPGMAIARAYDALKEDGILYLVAIAYGADFGKRKWFRRKRTEVEVKKDVDSNKRIFSMSSLLWLLESHQFEVENTFKQPNLSIKSQKQSFKEKHSGLVSIAARKKQTSQSSVVTSKSIPAEGNIEQEQIDEREKTDAPFFQTEPEKNAEEQNLFEATVLESEDEDEAENKHGDDTV